MWLDTYYKTKGMERLSERRVRRRSHRRNVLSDRLTLTRCPVFEDAVKQLGFDKQMVVRDVVELLAESLEE